MASKNEKYLEAITSSCVTDTVSGTITLLDGTEIEVSKNTLYSNNLSITEQITPSRYSLGAFNTAQLKIAVMDDDSLEHDFSGACVNLKYGVLNDSTWYYYPLGKYFVDGKQIKRKRDIVWLTAFDSAAKFDVEKPQNSEKMNIFSALTSICLEAGVSFSTTLEEFAKFPNSALEISVEDKQIQSCRDCVMWIASLLGGYARINRSGSLEIRAIDYKSADGTTIDYDRKITGSERKTTDFSDTRIYAKRISAYAGGKIKTYTSTFSPTDTQAAAGVLTIEENPIIKDFSEAEADDINKNILKFVDNFMQRTIKTVIFGDPSIEAGDCIQITGGNVDVRNSIIGVVTKSVWKFRGQHTLYCDAPEALEAVEQPAQAKTRSVVIQKAYLTPRLQIDKRIDGVVGGSSGGGAGGTGTGGNGGDTVTIGMRGNFEEVDYLIEPNSDMSTILNEILQNKNIVNIHFRGYVLGRLDSNFVINRFIRLISVDRSNSFSGSGKITISHPCELVGFTVNYLEIKNVGGDRFTPIYIKNCILGASLPKINVTSVRCTVLIDNCRIWNPYFFDFDRVIIQNSAIVPTSGGEMFALNNSHPLQEYEALTISDCMFFANQGGGNFRIRNMMGIKIVNCTVALGQSVSIQLVSPKGAVLVSNNVGITTY